MAKDHHGREIDYLRISVTDRCNLRCRYCMPEEGIKLEDHTSIMSLEEIERLVYIASQRGINRIRLTGGEPLVRLGIVDLIASLSKMEGIDSVTLTTNGILLPKMATELKDAGLSRVNISLDTLDAEQFKFITRCGDIEGTLKGIEAALETGFNPVKVNVVAIRSLNQDFLAFAKLTVDKPLHIRFIEYMPMGDSHRSGAWSKEESIPSDELIERIDSLTSEAGLGNLMPLEKGKQVQGWGPARYFELPNAQGTIGFISPLSRHFCGECNRLRVTANGRIRPCLFSDEEYHILEALRNNDVEAVNEVFDKALLSKPDEHHHRMGTSRAMSQIGG